MALMFQRLARNFIKNGYFPTDAETLTGILAALMPVETGRLRILDPCCGEGTALAECAAHLGRERVEAYGIEYDAEHAWHAKRLLDRCIHGDCFDVAAARRRFGLVFLNPPYGDLVSDQAQTAARRSGGRQRHEKRFYQRAKDLLQFGGVLVLIVPTTCLDRELCGWVATHFRDVRVFEACVATYKQVIIFGVRRRTQNAGDTAPVGERLLACGRGEPAAPLPLDWPPAERYTVPASAHPEAGLQATRLDAAQLGDELTRHPGLWDRFEANFQHQLRPHRRPLRALSTWHLALALAAGQVAGVVSAPDGRVFVIKGDTHKERETEVNYEARADGSMREIRTLTDRFVPVIRALDFTPGSPSFGQALTIV
jgi:hypothetical protein